MKLTNRLHEVLGLIIGALAPGGDRVISRRVVLGVSLRSVMKLATIYVSFNEAAFSSKSTAVIDGLISNNELKGIWKEAVML
jgi:hypothetical protein